MKLIIQIPSFNEEAQLPDMLRSMPDSIPGIDSIDLLLVDDGSVDETVSVARSAGVRNIIRLPQHRGLAAAFSAGLDEAVAMGADIIVNFDADNQYPADAIRLLLEPILAGRAEIVIGDRGIGTLSHFSMGKRLLQRLGSWIVSQASGIPTPDATSGFRAYSRSAAMQTHLLSHFSFTLESLIQAGAKGIPIAFVSVPTNPPTRPSRLMRSTPHYLLLSAATLIRAYAMYSPLKIFSLLGGFFFTAGIALGARFLYYLLVWNQGSGHIQSLILSAVLLILGVQIGCLGLIADLIAANRKILEDSQYRIKRLEHSTRK
jgi:glycosyltransferase involved in cell wall biosynthesis